MIYEGWAVTTTVPEGFVTKNNIITDPKPDSTFKRPKLSQTPGGSKKVDPLMEVPVREPLVV